MSIEEQQQYYDHLWHQHNAGLDQSLDPFDRDVQIARAVMQTAGISEAQKVLCRSPKTRLLSTAPDDRWHDYIVKVTCAAQERLLPILQRQEGKRIAMVLMNILNHYQTNGIDGQRYQVQFNQPEQSLTLTAKDGRGLLLKQQNGYLTQTSLQDDDVRFLDAAQQRLSAAAFEQRQSQQKTRRGLGLG